MKAEEVALNLLANKHCHNCGASCDKKSSSDTCEKWSEIVHENIMTKLMNASNAIRNNLSRGSPSHIIMSSKNCEIIKNMVEQELGKIITSDIDTKVSVDPQPDNTAKINVMVKQPVYAEYVTLEIQVKNENK